MRVVNIRDFQHHLADYMDQVEAGETIEIRRRRKVIARIVPCVENLPAESWPDLVSRLSSLYPDGPVEPAASDILYQARGD